MSLLPKLTPNEEQIIINDYLQNPRLTIKELSKKYRRKPDTIRQAFIKNKIKVERNRKVRISEEVKFQVINLYQNGKVIREIGNQFDISHGSISNILKEAGLSKRAKKIPSKQKQQQQPDPVKVIQINPFTKILYENLIPFEEREDGVFLMEENKYLKVDSGNDDLLGNNGLRFTPTNLTVRLIDFKTANALLERAHYLGGASKATSYYFGFYCDHPGKRDDLIGVATFGRVANPHEKLLCLSRFCVLERARVKNLSSRLMSMALKFLKQQGYIGKVVSWSDTRRHSGGLYKATNWKLITNKKYKRDYIYVDQTGREFHKSICRVKAGVDEKSVAKQRGLIRVEVPPKQRWEYEIK